MHGLLGPEAKRVLEGLSGQVQDILLSVSFDQQPQVVEYADRLSAFLASRLPEVLRGGVNERVNVELAEAFVSGQPPPDFLALGVAPTLDHLDDAVRIIQSAHEGLVYQGPSGLVYADKKTAEFVRQTAERLLSAHSFSSDELRLSHPPTASEMGRLESMARLRTSLKAALEAGVGAELELGSTLEQVQTNVEARASTVVDVSAAADRLKGELTAAETRDDVLHVIHRIQDYSVADRLASGRPRTAREARQQELERLKGALFMAESLGAHYPRAIEQRLQAVREFLREQPPAETPLEMLMDAAQENLEAVEVNSERTRALIRNGLPELAQALCFRDQEEWPLANFLTQLSNGNPGTAIAYLESIAGVRQAEALKPLLECLERQEEAEMVIIPDDVVDGLRAEPSLEVLEEGLLALGRYDPSGFVFGAGVPTTLSEVVARGEREIADPVKDVAGRLNELDAKIARARGTPDAGLVSERARLFRELVEHMAAFRTKLLDESEISAEDAMHIARRVDIAERVRERFGSHSVQEHLAEAIRLTNGVGAHCLRTVGGGDREDQSGEASPVLGYVNLSTAKEEKLHPLRRTVFHEVGHLWEGGAKWLLAVAHAFRDWRVTGGVSQYGDGIEVLAGSFISKYVGRPYDVDVEGTLVLGPTEVASVGLELFENPERMAEFILGDREHFALMVGARCYS